MPNLFWFWLVRFVVRWHHCRWKIWTRLPRVMTAVVTLPAHLEMHTRFCTLPFHWHCLLLSNNISADHTLAALHVGQNQSPSGRLSNSVHCRWYPTSTEWSPSHLMIGLEADASPLLHSLHTTGSSSSSDTSSSPPAGIAWILSTSSPKSWQIISWAKGSHELMANY